MARGWDPLAALMEVRGGLLPWLPVALSFGIGGYFLLPREPLIWEWSLAAIACAALALAGRRGPERWRLPMLGAALVVGGLCLAGARAHQVAAPVLSWRYYGAVEGRVVGIDRSYSDQLRLTLDQVVLERISRARTPGLVRVALHGDQAHIAPVPGQRVILTAHLSPPEGPVEPGGFDFQRLAWFSGLGAVGYTRAPVLELSPPEPSLGLLAFRWRMWISAAMQARMPGQAGAFASALVTGDRSGVLAETNEVLRNSNLSHLISISGLHMGLLAGFVFAALRYGLALFPPLALRLPVKKLAALAAIAAASFYMLLAGPNVATERAYVMALVMLVAVLADRRAISLRSVALAATLLLVLEPESLTEPGFQMSFGATTALIAGFGLLKAPLALLPRWASPVVMLVLSSAIAGGATAPIAAAHFNRIAEYGLIANFVAVPVMGILVMPAAVCAAVLAPFGLAQPALWVMQLGTATILAVARWVSGLEGAVVSVPTPQPAVLPLLAVGALLACLTATRLPRLLGIAALSGAFMMWQQAPRPAVLVAPEGALIGVMTDSGRALSKPRGAGFIAENWLQGDGDLASQEQAFGRSGAKGKAQTDFVLAGLRIHHFTGKSGPAAAASACQGGALVILAGEGAGIAGDCTLFDLARLRDTGSLAIEIGTQGMMVLTARAATGDRLWNARPSRRARQVANPGPDTAPALKTACEGGCRPPPG